MDALELRDVMCQIYKELKIFKSLQLYTRYTNNRVKCLFFNKDCLSTQILIY